MSLRNFDVRYLLTAAVLTICCSVSPAFAEPVDDSILDLPIEELLKIDVVTVTARKREENLQEVPISVSALRGEKLDVLKSGAADIRFLNGRLPSLTVESSFGRTFPRFYIRGIGNTDFDLNASQPVSIVVDEVVHENPILKGFPVFDTDRIEVLRGPQGSLFGRNTPAGVIKFESKKPTKELDGYASAAYGEHNTVDIEGAVSDSLTDNLSARISFLRQQRSDYIANQAPGFEENDALDGYHDTAGRIQFLLEPNDRFSALLNYHIRDLTGSPIPFRANVVKPGTNDFADGFEIDEVFQDAARTADQDVETHGGSLKMEYDLDQYTITSVSGLETVDIFSRADVDGGFGAAFLPEGASGPGVIPFPAETGDGIPDHLQFTQELRISSNFEDEFDFQAGLFYFYEDLEVESRSFDTLAGGVQNGFAKQEQETNAAAVFGTVSYDASDDLTFTVGSRYSYDEKDFHAARLQGPLDSGTIGPIVVDPDDSHVSWDVSAVYDISDDVHGYGRIANGFRAPSIQGRILFGDEVTVADSEEVLSFELGLKSDIMDGRGRVNGSVFYYLMDKQQLTAVGGGSNFNRLVNADETMGYGVELDSEFAITPNFTLSANTSFNHTELNDENLFVSACAQCTITDPLNDAGQAIIDGNRLPHAPEWIANIAARYEYGLGDGELFIFTDWVYRSEINFFLYESREFTGEYLLEGGVKAGYQWSGESADYEIAVFSRNITDQESLIGGIDFNNLTGIVNEGRFFGASFRANFF